MAGQPTGSGSSILNQYANQYESTHTMPSKQVITIGRKTFPVSYGVDGPTITGVFTPEQKRHITRVYGVRILNFSEASKAPPKYR
jgi:hypothetical protein